MQQIGGMCIGGVFGGIDSGITNETTEMFLESALFNPVYIRKTARRHGLNTDASFRFERGVDPNGTIYALKRAAILICEIAGERSLQRSLMWWLIQPYWNPFAVSVSYNNITKLIGKEIPAGQIKIFSPLSRLKSFRRTRMALNLPSSLPGGCAPRSRYH